jgi:hypothetical protein
MPKKIEIFRSRNRWYVRIDGVAEILGKRLYLPRNASSIELVDAVIAVARQHGIELSCIDVMVQMHGGGYAWWEEIEVAA